VSLVSLPQITMYSHKRGQGQQDIFSPNLIPQFYSLEKYHIHGSRILSRSFQVEKWEGEDDVDEENPQANASADSGMDVANTSAGSGMDVDEDPANAPQPDESADSDDEDVGDPSDVAMVPMADMLNARYGSENVGNSSTDTGLREEYLLFSEGKIIP
jgi:SET domain-containing protein 6